MAAIKNRYDFVILFDVENGNPNGDPDAGNMPRVDPETGFGLVTDVCLKRKIRNYVQTVKEADPFYQIYIREGTPLNTSDNAAIEALGIDPDLKKAKQKDPGIDEKLRGWMCEHYYDIRTFGAVMTTFVKGALNCGQVRGPNKKTEMGSKHIVPYGLYRAEGYVSANLARKTTGFSTDDLELLWTAILNMFENDHSAARGKMAVRELIIFKHDSELGCAPSYKLFEAVHVARKEGVEIPRSYQDYTVTVSEPLPEGVHCERRS